MDEVIAELLRAPLWAQIALALFAATVLWSSIGSGVSKHRYRRRFDAIARELDVAPSTAHDWPITVAVTADGRPFEVRHDFGGGRNYRGPLGYLLITSTPLGGSKWALHQVDIERRDSRWTWLGKHLLASGDTGFDARFGVVQDGVPVREGWLDAPTRAAVASFFDHAPIAGPIWIHDGRLRYTIASPWKGVDGAAVRKLLRRQAALAAALEATASGRW